ncbi:MAG TPA: hypothetical protein VHZ25_14280 [Acidobacteriaceae bacterium]|jgi:hypothetical protein|nr:hypothetical protein [Acidobacteriaceae bacterium]
MTRAIAVLVAMSALFAPALVAQNSTVCVFQQKQGRAVDVDGGLDSSLLARELIARTSSGSPAFDILPITGFGPKEIDAEAQHRNCAWVVTVWRQEVGPNTPDYGGSLGNTQASAGQNNTLMVKSNKIGEDTLLEFTLRKPDSHKAIAKGEGDEKTTYGRFADTIVKKIK